MPETIGDWHHVPAPGHSADDFIKDSIRNISISADKHIRALIGKLKSKPQGGTVVKTYLFHKDHWTMAEAKAWVKEHAKTVGKALSVVIPAIEIVQEIGGPEALEMFRENIGATGIDRLGGYILLENVLDSYQVKEIGATEVLKMFRDRMTGKVIMEATDQTEVTGKMNLNFSVRKPLGEFSADLRNPMKESVRGALKSVGEEPDLDNYDVNVFLEFSVWPKLEEAGERPASKSRDSEAVRTNILMINDEEQKVFGIVLEPREKGDPDAQDTYYTEEDVVLACHRFNAKLSRGDLVWKVETPDGREVGGKRRAGDMHKRWDSDIDIIESATLWADTVVIDMTGAERTLKRGTWIMGQHIKDNQLWKKIKEGKRTGFSIIGTVTAIPEE